MQIEFNKEDTNMNEFINIVLASDDNYAQHLAVVAVSILSNTKVAKDVRFFILNDAISDEKKILIKETVDSFGASAEFLDSTGNELDGVFLSGHISKAAYFRLLIAELVPENVKKVIYMDVDLLVCDDIEKLWRCDLKGNPVAAVQDFGIAASSRMLKQKANVLGMKNSEHYFNSGVLVIDIAQWRLLNYGKKVLHVATNEQLPHHDQDALNKVFMNNWCLLPLRWNVIPPVFYLFSKVLLNKEFRKQALTAKKDPAIIHYAGRYKPWEFTVYKGFNDLYYKYLALSKFANAKMPQPSKKMQGKSILRQLLRLKIANFWQKVLNINE